MTNQNIYMQYAKDKMACYKNIVLKNAPTDKLKDLYNPYKTVATPTALAIFNTDGTALETFVPAQEMTKIADGVVQEVNKKIEEWNKVATSNKPGETSALIMFTGNEAVDGDGNGVGKSEAQLVAEFIMAIYQTTTKKIAVTSKVSALLDIDNGAAEVPNLTKIEADFTEANGYTGNVLTQIAIFLGILDASGETATTDVKFGADGATNENSGNCIADPKTFLELATDAYKIEAIKTYLANDSGSPITLTYKLCPNPDGTLGGAIVLNEASKKFSNIDADKGLHPTEGFKFEKSMKIDTAKMKVDKSPEFIKTPFSALKGFDLNGRGFATENKPYDGVALNQDINKFEKDIKDASDAYKAPDLSKDADKTTKYDAFKALNEDSKIGYDVGTGKYVVADVTKATVVQLQKSPLINELLKILPNGGKDVLTNVDAGVNQHFSGFDNKVKTEVKNYNMALEYNSFVQKHCGVDAFLETVTAIKDNYDAKAIECSTTLSKVAYQILSQADCGNDKIAKEDTEKCWNEIAELDLKILYNDAEFSYTYSEYNELIS